MSVFLLAMGFLLPFIALGSLAHYLPIFLIKSLFGWLQSCFFAFIPIFVAVKKTLLHIHPDHVWLKSSFSRFSQSLLI
jgi:hypothetical protein